MEIRKEFVERVLSDGNMSEACREFEISRPVGYKWVRRCQGGGHEALADQSRAPRRIPHKAPEEVSARLLAVRQRHKTWGPKKVLAHEWSVAWLAFVLLFWRVRRRRRCPAMLFLATFFSLGACTDVVDPAIEAVSSVHRFADRLQVRQCQRFSHCALAHDDLADLANCKGWASQYASSIVGKGWLDPDVRYDPHSAAACLDWLDANVEACRVDGSAGFDFVTSGPCASVFAGPLSVGAACDSSISCASHLCGWDDGRCPLGRPKCASLKDEQNPCKTDHDCSWPDSCRQGVCRRDVFSLGTGSACDEAHHCLFGLACIGHVCVSRLQLGDDCDDNDPSRPDCGWNLDCIAGEGGKKCRRWFENQVCLEDDDCGAKATCGADGYCLGKPTLGQACKDSIGCREYDTRCSLVAGKRICTLAPGAGQACTTAGNESAKACIPGLFCSGKHCVARANLGEFCGSLRPCQPELHCIHSTCRAASPLGGLCGVTDDCAQGLRCLGKTCQLRLALGEKCSDESPCGPGLVCRANVCAAPGGKGAPCNWYADCAEGLDCNGSECTDSTCGH